MSLSTDQYFFINSASKLVTNIHSLPLPFCPGVPVPYMYFSLPSTYQGGQRMGGIKDLVRFWVV